MTLLDLMDEESDEFGFNNGQCEGKCPDKILTEVKLDSVRIFPCSHNRASVRGYSTLKMEQEPKLKLQPQDSDQEPDSGFFVKKDKTKKRAINLKYMFPNDKIEFFDDEKTYDYTPTTNGGFSTTNKRDLFTPRFAIKNYNSNTKRKLSSQTNNFSSLSKKRSRINRKSFYF